VVEESRRDERPRPFGLISDADLLWTKKKREVQHHQVGAGWLAGAALPASSAAADLMPGLLRPGHGLQRACGRAGRS
jgi:hypothetical protein